MPINVLFLLNCITKHNYLVKKIIISFFISFIVLSFSHTLQSQETKPAKWSFGITGGPQFTHISSPGGLPAAPESGVGFLAGAFAQYSVFKDLHIKLGANFDRRSFQLTYLSPYLVVDDTMILWKSHFSYDLSYNVDYFTIPLSIQYTKGEGKFKLFVQGTFYYSFYLSASKDGYIDTYINDDDFTHINPENYPDLNPGHNKDEFNGKTEDFLKNQKFNSGDIGISFFIGGIYQLSEKVGIYLSPGFTSSFGRVLENPVYDAKWIRVFKLETGVVINLK